MLAVHARSLKERNLFVVALIFSALVWLCLCVSIIPLLYAPFVALATVVAHAFLLARITGNSVRLGSGQMPELYKRVEAAATKLGLRTMPEVYIVSGGGILNAFATKLFSRSFVILHAEILDACEKADEGKDPGQPLTVDFIIGHELGHLALGHLSWNWLLWPAKAMPLLGPAYSRACEYSCDACGLAACDDIDTAGRALAILGAGGQARHVALDALVQQRHDTGSLVMALVELNSSHPYLSKRVAAVQRLRDGDLAPEIGRNPVSYVLAPFFSGVAAYMMIYVAVLAAFVGVAAGRSAGADSPFDLTKLLAGAPPSSLEAPTHPLADSTTDAATDAAAEARLQQLLKDLKQENAAAAVPAPQGDTGAPELPSAGFLAAHADDAVPVEKHEARSGIL